MTWSDFYLICFAIGFLLKCDFVHLGQPASARSLAACAQPAWGGAWACPWRGRRARGKPVGVSPLNFFTIAIFLAWFGGTGYLLARYSAVVFALGLFLSALVGLMGATIVFLFLARVLSNPEAEMDQADYEMVGVVGRVSSPIRAAGVGEIIFSQAGKRRCCAARSDTGAPLTKDIEVVVARYERGVAYVRPWDEFTGESSEPRASSHESTPER